MIVPNNANLTQVREGHTSKGKSIDSWQTIGTDESYHQLANKDVADLFSSTMGSYLEPLVAAGRSLKLTPQDPKAPDGLAALQSGLELSGDLLMGIPGASLKLISANDKVTALLVNRDGTSQSLETNMSAHTYGREAWVTMPDQSELVFFASEASLGTGCAVDRMFRTSVFDRTRGSLRVDFGKTPTGYTATGLTLNHDGKLSATELASDLPELVAYYSEGLRGRTLSASQLADGSGEVRCLANTQAPTLPLQTTFATMRKIKDRAAAIWAHEAFLLDR